MHILEDVGISFDPSFGSPSSLLDVIRANELAHEDIARAKEAASQASVSLVVASGVEVAPERDQVSTAAPRRGAGIRDKSFIAPCRSSLHIKNLSLRRRLYFGILEVSVLGGAGTSLKIWFVLKMLILLALSRLSNPPSPLVNSRSLLG